MSPRRGFCHCGAVELEVLLPEKLTDLRRCNRSICGIYPHHQRRSTPNEFSVNVACLDGVDPFELGEVRVVDGVNHPSDRAEE